MNYYIETKSTEKCLPVTASVVVPEIKNDMYL